MLISKYTYVEKPVGEYGRHHVAENKKQLVDEMSVFLREHDLSLDGHLDLDEFQDVRPHRLHKVSVPLAVISGHPEIEHPPHAGEL